MVTLLPAEAALRIAELATPEFGEGEDGISPFVTSSVVWSLYTFLRTPDDYWATICTAIAAGGDADTTAAMAGAVSGAHVGLAGLPAERVRRVHDQWTWGYDELVALAEACFARIAGNGSG